jgi:hypothetical protein
MFAHVSGKIIIAMVSHSNKTVEYLEADDKEDLHMVFFQRIFILDFPKVGIWQWETWLVQVFADIVGLSQNISIYLSIFPQLFFLNPALKLKINM